MGAWGRVPLHFRPTGAVAALPALALVCMENVDRRLSFSVGKILHTMCAWL